MNVPAASALVNSADAKVVALLWAHDDPSLWADCVRTLLKVPGIAGIHIAAVDPIAARRLYSELPGLHVFEAWTLADAIEKAESVTPHVDALLVVFQPVSVPADILENVSQSVELDSRTATISFLSNSAGYLSFPYRNTSVPFGIGGMDETTVTRCLRSRDPAGELVPIPMPAGSCVLINMSPYRLCGGVDADWSDTPKLSLAQFALKAARRGFVHALDSATYVTVPWLSNLQPYEAIDDEVARHRLHVGFREFPALYDQEREAFVSPLAIGLDLARVKVQGLRILIDGSCLGDMEMGTQVQTVCLIDALARRTDVQSITVGLPNGRVPSYASRLLRNGNLRFCPSADLHFEGAGDVDIVHRPFQPDAPIPWARWKQLGKRVIITIQDLIAYKIGSYHRDGQTWLKYRESMAAAVRNADGVVTISDDTLAVVRSEKLNTEDGRICVAKNGSDHVDLDQGESIPTAVLEAGLVSQRYLLVLGANYTHKNRDLAIRVWSRLKEMGHEIALVMAGAQVPMGSSRLEEAALRLQLDEDLLSLPDVSSLERNWLMRHAALVLYPTSSEGFGLVPFEAASMGVPTVHVSFGPLRELIEDSSIPRTWSVEDLALYAHSILIEPAKASQVVRTILRNAEALTWDDTAAKLVEFYRSSLSKAPR